MTPKTASLLKATKGEPGATGDDGRGGRGRRHPATFGDLGGGQRWRGGEAGQRAMVLVAVSPAAAALVVMMVMMVVLVVVVWVGVSSVSLA